MTPQELDLEAIWAKTDFGWLCMVLDYEIDVIYRKDHTDQPKIEISLYQVIKKNSRSYNIGPLTSEFIPLNSSYPEIKQRTYEMVLEEFNHRPL